MVETYQDFLKRISSFEVPYTYYGENYIHMNPNLSDKVEGDNSFKPFFGDTIVFDLKQESKDRLNEIANSLYETVPECFAERLKSHTFHMTLHDLSNSPWLHEIAQDVFFNELNVLERKNRVVKNQKIRMKTRYIFNMVSNSLVLGLYPSDEEEYHKLMSLYYLFHEVKELNYPLTPHITLGYYNVHGFSADSARKLEKLIGDWNQVIEDMELEINTDDLYYQKFVNMNHYVDVIRLG